jgi:hypothetical protein
LTTYQNNKSAQETEIRARDCDSRFVAVCSSSLEKTLVKYSIYFTNKDKCVDSFQKKNSVK